MEKKGGLHLHPHFKLSQPLILSRSRFVCLACRTNVDDQRSHNRNRRSVRPADGCGKREREGNGSSYHQVEQPTTRLGKLHVIYRPADTTRWLQYA
jgi:hypothetical protein